MNTVFASSGENNKDAKNMLESIKEIRYNVDTETNFKNYDLLVSKAIIDFKKYQEKHPLSDKNYLIEEKLHNLIYYYYDARVVWEEAIYNKKIILSDDDIKLLRAKQPNLLVSRPYNSNNTSYYYQDVLIDLWRLAEKDETILGNLLSPKIKPHAIKHP